MARRQQGENDTRRRVVVAVTLLVGVPTLGLTLHLQPGDDTFVLGALAMAAVWSAGALACWPLPLLGPGPVGRQVRVAALVGCGALLLCLAGGLAVSLFDGLADLAQPAKDLLSQRTAAALPVMVMITALNGVAEELFFRGALYGVLPARRAWLLTAAIYTLATLASGILLLTVAAALIGVLTGLLRRSTHGLVAPVVAHLVWSLGMLLLLPSVLLPGR